MSKRIRLVRNENGESNVLYQEKPLYSRYAPSASAERAASKTAELENCIYIVPSPLLGYGIDTLLNRIPSTSVILCLEADSALAEEAELRYANPDPQRCFNYALKSSSELYAVFRSLQRGQYRNCVLVPLNAAYALQRSSYDSLFSVFQHFLKNYWHNRLTMARMGSLWIENMCANIGRSELQDMSDFRTDKPVVLTGAGESLEDLLPFIRNNREDIYLLSVDTAVQSLTASGIIPDGIVNLEAQFFNQKDFYSVQNTELDLFSDITAYPPTLRNKKHRHYYFSSTFEETMLHSRLRQDGRMPREIPPLGSVGVAAVYLASIMTSRAVFICGLDFAYTAGKTHAKDTPFHDWCRLQENRLSGDVWYDFSLSRPATKVAGKQGTVLSNPILEGYGRQLKDLCPTLPVPVYDLGRKGLDLSLPAMTEIQWQQLLKELKEKDLQSNRPVQTVRTQSSAAEFIDKEQERLKKLLDQWESYSAGESEGEKLLPLLKDCDYLYFDFPEGKLPNAEPAFLVRVITRARKLSRLLSSKTD